MQGMLALAETAPTRTLSSREVLIEQGSTGGHLFVLQSGRLAVERDGIKIATLTEPGALLGEMSVLLGSASSATVRAEGNAVVRVIRDARQVLEQDATLTFLVASLVASRLDKTSAFLVQLSKQHSGKNEQGLLSSILSTLHLPASGNYVPVNREDLFG